MGHANIHISFVIPTRDEALYIRQTLSEMRRALREYPDATEVIVVDGGSTDGTVAEAQDLADSVVMDVARARRNIAGARNVGATGSRGQLLFHMDADVRFEDLPGFLRTVAVAFEDRGLVAATTSIWPYPWAARKVDFHMHRLGNAVIRATLPVGARLARGECLIVRRETFEALHGFDERLALGEDCDLFRRASRLGRVTFIRGHRVLHSPRRFQKWGYLRIAFIFGREAVWQWVLRRPYLREWKPVR